jgi:DNA-binding SARP family transcriptional activator
MRAPTGDTSGDSPSQPRSIVFRLLGPLEVVADDVPLRLGGPKQRSVLALLLLGANRVVPLDRIIRGLWGESLPSDAAATVQVYVSNLRRILNPSRAPGAETIERKEPGYQVAAIADRLDLLRFDQLLVEAVEQSLAERFALAERTYRSALALWRGRALADLIDNPLSPAATQTLEERRNNAEEELFLLGLRRGGHRDLIPDLEAAVAANPLRERLYGLMMVAMYRSGRQTDALNTYQRARRELREHGVGPSPDLQRLERAVLSQEPELGITANPLLKTQRPSEGSLTSPRFVQGSGRGALELSDGTTLPIGDRPLVIGRQTSCDLVIGATDVSRRHIEIRPTVVGPLLIDLGSTNGTLVNGTPVHQHVLQDGDQIVVGSHEIAFYDTAPAT